MPRLSSIKTKLIIYLACFALFLALKDKDFTFLCAAIVAVISAVTAEAAILYFKTKTFRITESSIITGLIVGYVLSSDEAWFKLVFASLAAILSKYVIRFRNKHIFNPAAFGIFLSIILLGATTQWHGTYLWYIVAAAGLYFAYKFRKIEIIVGYAIFFLALFGVQAVVQKVPVAGIFGYLSYFYIFVMVIEPKTTPTRTPGKYLFGAVLVILIFILTQAGLKFDVELLSLLAMNAAVPLLNKLSPKKEV